MIKLLTEKTNEAKNFQDNIIHYNAALAFASRKAFLDPLPLGPYCMRIHGAVYHRSGCLRPQENTAPRYAQLYIIDAESSLNQRMNMVSNNNCQADLMKKLDELVKANNPYYTGFRQMHQLFEEQTNVANLLGVVFTDPKLYLYHKVYIIIIVFNYYPVYKDYQL